MANSKIEAALKAREQRNTTATTTNTSATRNGNNLSPYYAEKKNAYDTKIQTALNARRSRIQANLPNKISELESRLQAEIDAYNASSGAFGEGAFEKTVKSQTTRRANISKLAMEIEAYKPYLEEESANSLLELLSQMKGGYDAYVSMSQFDNEDDYNKAVRFYGYEQQHSGKSYTDLRKSMEQMDSNSEEYKWLDEYSKSDDVMTVEDYKKLIYQTETKLNDFLENEDFDATDTNSRSVYDKTVADYEAELERLRAGQWRVENKEKYGGLSENADFKKQSQVAEDGYTAKIGLNIGDNWIGVGDPVYDYINDLDNAQKRYEITNDGSDMQGLYKYSFMNDTERSTYNYLYNTDGKKAAKEYLDYLGYELDARRLQQISTDNAEFAKEHPVLASAYSVPANLMSGIGYLDVAGQNAVKGIKEAVTGEYAGPINYNSWAMTPSVASTSIRGTVAEDLAKKGAIELDTEEHPILSRIFNGKTLGDAYQLGMSMADSTAVALLTPIVGSAGTVLLGGSAATQGVLDAVANGATDGQALTIGIINGAAEWAFEKIGVDNLVNKIIKGDKGGIVRAFLSQGLSEGGEELGTSLVNNIADYFIMAEKSGYSKLIAQYVEQGLSKEEAAAEALKDITAGMVWDFVGGFATGGIMGTSGHAIGSGLQSIAENAEAKQLYGPSTAEIVSEALEYDPDNKLAKKIQTKLKGGKEASGGQILNLVNQRDKGAIAKAAEARLTALGETGDVKALSTALAKQAAGEKLTKTEQQTISKSKYGKRVSNELNPENIRNGEFASDWAENIGTRRINALEYGEIAKLKEQARAVDEYNKNHAPIAPRKIEQTAQAKPAEVKPTGNDTVDAVINKAHSKELSGNDVRPILDSPEAVKALETVVGNLDLKGKSSSEQRSIVREAITSYAAAHPVAVAASTSTGSKAVPSSVESVASKYGKQAGAVRSIYNIAPVENVDSFATAFETAYQIGLEGGYESAAVESSSTQVMSESQRRLAYATGKAVRAARQLDGIKRSSKGGGIVRARGMKAEDINKRFKKGSNQKTALQVLRSIAEATGFTIEVFDSSGDYSMEQGSFDWTDDVIRIDIASGICKAEDVEQLAKYAMLRTFCHEFTHTGEKWAAEEYNILRTAVIEALSENEDYDLDYRIAEIQRIDYEAKKAQYMAEGMDEAAAAEKAEAEKMSWDMASREVVAEAMTDVLPESNFIRSLYEKSPSLAKRLGEALRRFLARVKEYYNGLVSNPSREAQALKVEIGGTVKYLEGIVDKWDAMAIAAVENYQNAAVEDVSNAEVSVAKVTGTADGAVERSTFTDKMVSGPTKQMQVRTEEEAYPKMIMSPTGGAPILVTADMLPGLASSPVKGLVNGKEVDGFTGRQIRNYVMKQEGFSTAQRKHMNEFMGEMSKFMKDAGLTYKFIGLQDVDNAKLSYSYNPDGSIKSIILSAMVKNGDYPVNFDLTSICKKRVAMSSLIAKLCERGSIDSGIVDLTPANIFKINTALKDAGYETACLGCFVESKRYNVQDWAVKFCNKWNAAVKKVNPNATYFGYGKGETADVTIDRAVKLDAAASQYITESKGKRLESAMKKYMDKEAKGETLIEGKTVKVFGEEIHNTFSKAARDRIEKSYTLSEELKQKYLTCDVTTLTMEDVALLLEHEILPGASVSNKMAVTNLVNSGEDYQHLLRPSDLLTAEGIAQLEKLPNFHGVLYGHYGSGTPKLVQGFTPYNSEIALLPAKKGKVDLAEYLYSIAGVRMQSFSDFQIQNIYDYLQMVGDLAARKLPAHAYTKEMPFAKLLGMTGIKTNLSVMFDIDYKVDRAHAGLTLYDPEVHKGEYAKIVLEDEQGQWVYNIGDYATQQAYERAYPDESKRFLQSIGFADAVKLQTSEGYTANCGIIGVGFSDLGIRAMLDDKRIRYVIPYHASSLPDVIKKATNIYLGTDYTSWQNTTKIAGITDADGNKVKWSFKEATKRLGSAQAALNELNDHVENDGWIVSTKKAQNGHGSFTLYEDLQETNDPRKTADNFFEWCASNNTLPVFYQFAGHENYYKLLYDFNVYDCVTEEYAPHHEVRNIYPTKDADGNIVPGDATEEGFSSDYLRETINKQMSSMNSYFETLDKDLDTLAGNIEQGRFELGGKQFRLRSDNEMELENIKNGTKAIDKLISDAKNADNPNQLIVTNAMYRSDIGYIDFKWGEPGRGAKFKGGYGLSHIIAKRDSENSNGTETVYKIVEVIAKATRADVQGNDFTQPQNMRLRLFYDGYVAVLVRGENGNHWLLTGWENDKETVAYAVGEGYDSSNATAAKPTPTRLDGVNATVSSNEMIASDKANSQEQFPNTSQVQKQQRATMTEARIDDLIADSGAGSRTDYAQKWISSINPTDFLNMTLGRANQDRAKFDTMPGDYDSTVNDYDFIEGGLKKSRQTPYLAIDINTGEVVGHEGRHRMRALEKEGITSAEIVIELRDEDGRIIKELNGHGKALETIESLTIYNQRGTGQSTVIQNIIPLNKANRDNIIKSYGPANAGTIQYSHRGLNETQNKAVEVFGTTTDFNEVGFILPSGEMLKFTDNKHKGERQYDHRAIGMAYGVDVDLSVNHGFNEDSAGHLENFIEDGGIRFDPGDPDLDMDAGMQLSSSVPLTKEQERAIRDFVEWKQQREEAIAVDEDSMSLYSGPLALHIEFGGKAGIAVGQSSKNLDAWGVKHLSYEGGQINASRIISDIRHYYETGEVRQPSETARFRYQRRTPSYTDREVLELAKEDMSRLKLTDGERSALDIFGRRLDNLKNLEQQRDEQRRILAALNSAAKPDADEIRKTKSRLITLGKKIRDAENQVLSAENKQVLKKVLHTARRVVETEQRNVSRENRNTTAMRHKVKDIVNELNNYLLKGTKDKHVMIGLQKAVASALDVVNMDTIGAEERIAKLEAELMKAKTPEEIQEISRRIDKVRAQGEKMSEKLANLKAAYAEIKDSSDPLIANSHDEVIEATIESVAKSVGETPLRDMTLSQLQDVYDLYKMVLTTIRNSNKTFKADKKLSIDTLASNVQAEVEEVGGKKKHLKLFEGVNSFLWNNFKPVYAFKAIGSKTFSKLFDNVRAGEDVWARDVSEAKAFYLEQSKKYGYDGWNLEETHSFKSTSGMDFKLTLEQMMSLYAYSKRKQAEDHLKYGGIVFEDSFETKKLFGKFDIKLKTEDATAYNISPETLAAITGALTADQKGFVDAMQDYLSTTMGEKGNEVSLEMYGVKLFKEKFYFPLKSAPQYMAKAREQAKGEVKIKNSGFTKETNPKAKNPIVLESFMNVWANHVNDMSMYHAFTLPLEDFYRVYNYRTPSVNENMPTEGVNPAIQNAYGKAATNYVEQLLKDLNGGARSDPTAGFINKMMGLFKKGAVFASASVVVQQPSAVARAMALIDSKYFVGKKLDDHKHKALWEEVKQYAPVAMIKEMGYFDTNMGMSTVDFIKAKEYESWDEKMKALVTDSDYRDEALSKAPALADEMAWCMIWEAVKRETVAKHPALKVDSDELLQLAGVRFTEVIVNTQVYDSVLSRSANMRSKDTGMKMATAFLAEPTTTINMIADALIQGKRGDTTLARKAIGAAIASQILNGILVSFVYAARDDDEEKTYWEKYFATLLAEVKDSFNLATYIPFVKDIVSIVQGYDVERSDIAVIADLWKAYEQLDSDKISGWRKAENFVGGIAQLFGLPVKNIMRDARALYQTLELAFSSEKITAAGTKYAVKEALSGKTISNGQQLLESLIKGDEEHAERVMGRFEDENAANTAVRSAIKKGFEDGKYDEDTVMDLLMEHTGMDEDDAYWKLQEWLSDEEDYSKYNAIYEAVRNGGSIKEPMKELTSHGYKEKDVISQVKSQIGTWYKEGEITKQQATQMLTKYADMETEDITKTVNKWSAVVVTGIEYNDIKDAYLNGDITASRAAEMHVKYGGMTQEEADLKVQVYQWQKEVPGVDDITASAIEDYNEFAGPAGISKEIFYNAWTGYNDTEADYDEAGDSIPYSKTKKVMPIINSLPLTAQQKTALALCWWAEGTVNKYKLW